MHPAAGGEGEMKDLASVTAAEMRAQAMRLVPPQLTRRPSGESQFSGVHGGVPQGGMLQGGMLQGAMLGAMPGAMPGATRSPWGAADTFRAVGPVRPSNRSRSRATSSRQNPPRSCARL